MRRTLIAATAAAAVLAAPAADAAGKPAPKPRTKQLRATLAPAHTDAVYAGITGKAQLVDGKKNDKVSLHMKRLPRNQAYTWHVHKAKAGGNPCDAESGAADAASDTGFKYKALKTKKSGTANSTARSKKFTAEKGATYYIDVHSADGTVLACGVLKGRSKKAPPKKGSSKGGAKKPAPKQPVVKGKGRGKG